MESIKSRFTSRKFMLVLGAVLVALGSALSGQIEWYKAIDTIMTSVIAYLVAEGGTDVVRELKAKQDENMNP
jgi:Na+/H+ antiporter NhaC